jgi:hypothetical protein
MKPNPFLPVATLALTTLLTGCSKESGSGANFGAPNIGAIVNASVTSSLKGTSAYRTKDRIESLIGMSSAQASSATCTSASPSNTSGCSTASNYVEFVKSEVFQKITGVAAPQYYRYWVDVLDSAMAETNTRLAETSSAPACIDQAPAAVNFTFRVNGQVVTVTQKLQCWEQQTTPGAATQNMAFGKDSEYFYLVYRTNDNALTPGSGERYLLAKASADGNLAEIWFVGVSCQGTCSSRNDFKGNAQRVLANKSTGNFTFNSVEDSSVARNMTFGDFYGNTDGTNLYIEAAFGYGGTLTDVSGMTSSGSASNCVKVSDLTSLGSDCSPTLGRGDGMPSNFGLTAPMRNQGTAWLADSTAKTNYLADLLAISSIDYTAQGVGKFE